MNEDFVPLELAKKLKEKGFRKPCLAHYTNKKLEFNNVCQCEYVELGDLYQIWSDGIEAFVDAPTISRVLKWLRDKKLFVEINCNYTDYCSTVRNIDYHETYYTSDCDVYMTYEEAALAGIEYCLDNLI